MACLPAATSDLSQKRPKQPDSLPVPNDPSPQVVGLHIVTYPHSTYVLSPLGAGHGVLRTARQGACCRGANLSWTRADYAPAKDGVTTMTSLVLGLVLREEGYRTE